MVNGRGSIKPRNKLIILGYSPTSVNSAPINDESFDIWIMNDMYLTAKRFDAVFEMHPYKDIVSNSAEGKNPEKKMGEHLEKLRSLKTPIYTQKTFTDIPTAVKYPLEDISRAFPVCRDHSGKVISENYFTSTAAFMLALVAYWAKKNIHIYDEVRIYGVDMQHDTEYAHQRNCVEFWLGILIGMGIRVIVADQSDVLKSAYVYCYDNTEKVKKIIETKKKFLIDQRSQLTGQHDVLEVLGRILSPLFEEKRKILDKLNQLAGAESIVDYMEKMG